MNRWTAALGLALSIGPAHFSLTDGAELTFHRHDVNLDSTFPACAALDVNRDGRLDIVCGGWWYEAPDWERHFLREVSVIRGRYDDYSNLPLDVDGDGDLDVVSANYRSESIFWIENPGSKPVAWTTHVVEKPGNMETARLFDVDVDGQLDVLPAGRTFAAWWEVVRDRQATGSAPVTWRRNELPAELAGHGIGMGDVDGDGRGDVIGCRGWAKAPVDRRRGRWYWNADFRLHRDAGLPILCHDVDHDGDNDIVWGRGHNTGVYWLEQTTDGVGHRAWSTHAIDTSWSQIHSLLLADLDNDGKPEVIAGKRYLGHDGKDLGVYDPMMVCAYRFSAGSRTWERHVLSRGGPVGFDLDPKVVDLDGDGDLDLICPGRSGLCWLENRWVKPRDAAPFPPPTARRLAYDDHSNLMVFQDDRGQLQPVTNPSQWGLRRADILAAMQQVMGPLPDPIRRVPLRLSVLDETATAKYVRRKVTFSVDPHDRATAYLLVPRDVGHPLPAMLCLHQTTSIGKDEPAGLGGKASLHYAHELAELGYVCIVPDYPSFGDDKHDFNGGEYLSGSMKAIWNNVRSLDVLETMPEVDPDRIGCIGHSLGGHNGLFTAVFDLRIKAVVTSCGFTSFHAYKAGDLSGWTSPRYMPRIAAVYQNDPDRMPFEFHEVIAALAPRPVFINAPTGDDNFDIAGVREVVSKAAQVYKLVQIRETDQCTLVTPACGHDFPDDVRTHAYQWLGQRL